MPDLDSTRILEEPKIISIKVAFVQLVTMMLLNVGLHLLVSRKTLLKESMLLILTRKDMSGYLKNALIQIIGIF